MDEEFEGVGPYTQDAEHLVKTFVVLYDNWEKRPPDKQVDLKGLMKTFRQTCDNYGY